MKTIFNKVVSVILCLIVAVGLYPVDAYATTSNKIQYILESDVVRTDKIQNKDDINWYTYTMPENGAVSFKFTPDMAQLVSAGGYWNIKLYDANYNELEHCNDKTFTSKTYNFVKDTVFYITVEAAGYSKKSVGVEYSIVANYQSIDNWEIEDLTNPRKAVTLSNKKAKHGTLYYAKDEDVFKYKVPVNGPTKFVFDIPDY